MGLESKAHRMLRLGKVASHLQCAVADGGDLD